MTKTILIRYGELALKGPSVRSRFERKLADHARVVMPKVKVEREWGRLFAHTANWKKAQALKKVFGIVSFSLCEKFAFKNFDELCKKTMKLVKIPKKCTFAIRARRAGTHGFNSQDVAVKLGDLVRKKFSAKVDLDNPQHEVEIEVRQKEAYIVLKTEDGPGGMPFGTAGKVVCTVSGGIDSPVAAWMMMKRGCEPVFLHAKMEPLGGDDKRAKKILAKLREWSPKNFKLYVIPHGIALKDVKESGKSRLTCLLCKRMILKYASKVCDREKALAIVMGDSLGQVASQTLENLRVESYGINYPIFRPLIGFDKRDIVDLAKEIGTFEKSIDGAKPCGALPDKVATQARLEEVLDEDAFLEIAKIAETTVAKATIEEI